MSLLVIAGRESLLVITSNFESPNNAGSVIQYPMICAVLHSSEIKADSDKER